MDAWRWNSGFVMVACASGGLDAAANGVNMLIPSADGDSMLIVI